MRATIVPEMDARSLRGGWGERLGRALVRRAMSGLSDGSLAVTDAHGTETFGPGGGLSAAIRVHDARFWTLAAFGGSAGAGESYILGDWSCGDLTGLVRLLTRNYDALTALDGPASRVLNPLGRLAVWLSRNSRSGSKRNIVAHYDLGNEFFASFLDPTMMYSCALFERPGMTLEEASLAKLRTACEKLRLSPSDHLLEIGTGWGGMAIYAARNYGCRVTTTTISPSQARLARERIAAAGLGSRVTVIEKDYRDLDGSYDKLVSIEMIEAVGREYLDGYFAACSRLLTPEGAMLLQAIVIRDQRFERAAREVDFLKRFIFPGSCLLSLEAMARSTSRATDMRMVHVEDIGLHYPPTLRAWRERLFANIERVRAMGFDERFVRMWEFYLCYCEGAFLERHCGDLQLLLVKPRSRVEPPTAAAPDAAADREGEAAVVRTRAGLGAGV